MTRQEYFDLLVTTSALGGFPSVNDRGGPAYRGLGGRRDVIGIAIPDNAYSSEFEGKTIDDLPIRLLEWHSWTGCTLTELRDIQSYHDWLNLEPTWHHDTFVSALLAILKITY